MNSEQASLLDDVIDMAAIEAELQALQAVLAPTEKKQKPTRTVLPAEFPCTLIHHAPDNTSCPSGCALERIGEDVREKLDYTPGVFTVERHTLGKWVCDDCETLIQAPAPAQHLPCCSRFGFDAVLIAEGHTCSDTPVMKGEDIIAHHNATFDGPFCPLVRAEEWSF